MAVLWAILFGIGVLTYGAGVYLVTMLFPSGVSQRDQSVPPRLSKKRRIGIAIAVVLVGMVLIYFLGLFASMASQGQRVRELHAAQDEDVPLTDEPAE